MRIMVATMMVIAACGGEAAIDVDAGDATAIDARVDAPACATEPQTPYSDGAHIWTVAIAADGTTFQGALSPVGRIDQWSPGGGGGIAWAALPDHAWVFGLAFDPATELLWVAGANGLWTLDARAAHPQPTLVAAGQTRTVTIGPDGAVYSTRMGGGLYRRTAAGETFVASVAGPEPSDLLFDADGTLLLSELVSQRIYRITLDADHVGTVTEAAALPARPDALARGDDGRYYVGFDRGVTRYDAGFVNPIDVDDRQANDLAFARGYLGCGRLYVGGDLPLRILGVDGTGTP